MTMEACQACEAIAVSERVEPCVVERSGKSLTIQDRRMVCAECGNVSYQGSQISEHELAVANAIREMDGLLSAAELNAIRLKYRLRQADMEQILSTGPKTWTRWERGKVPQSKVADRYIRALARDPYLARREMLAAGVANPEAEAVFAQIEIDDRRRAHAVMRDALAGC
ncbi:type II TA system antitoxin MqsA family protein [Methylobacterium sp. 37f]|uniref:type II TA system antitoxin MqsA family protein n=1 Tax=Methylobacterium sp. 37f TaxID=2817058 RepID=UPI001FFDC17F|nr:type II TA system antitoxin MqsA family protein [Methylobacterium sp. 37f]MCK2056803.1 type II toxin-antitoxin system MqsA family antitoxin [Methylobacterium sp. 37f]